MIKLEHISKFYSSGENNVSLGLHNISLEMHKGEIIGVVGESGSGKSTFLNVISSIDTYEEGELYYDDVPVSSLSKKELEEFRKNHIGFIFQNYNLVDSFTVLQNVMTPLIASGVPHKEAKKRAKEIIEDVGLTKRIKHKGTKLSGGEKQRCVIARALASDSEILACDEPTGNLDSTTGKEIIELIKKVSKDKLVIIVTHNYEEIENIITRRIRFADGDIIEDVKLNDTPIADIPFKPNTSNHISFRETLRLSMVDNISTPKKFIITFIIFLAITFFSAFLFTVIFTFEKNSFYSDSMYNNIADERIVAINHKDNLDDFKNYEYYLNADIEDVYLNLFENDGTTIASNLRYSSDTIKLDKGRMPQNDNEIVLGVSDYAGKTYYNAKLSFLNYDNTKEDFTVVGYYYFDSTNTYYYVTGTEKTNERLKVNIAIAGGNLSFSAYGNIYDNWSFNSSINIDSQVPRGKVKITYRNDYVLDENSIKDNLYLIYDDEKRKVDCVEYIFDNINVDGFTISLSIDTYNDILKANTKNISIYERDADKRSDIVYSLRKKGYFVSEAKNAVVNNIIDIDGIFYAIEFTFMILGIGGCLVGIFFISYVVLGRVYGVRKKDYTILRTLGMSEKEMSRTVIFGTLILGIIAIFAVLITVYLCAFLKKPIIKRFNRIEWYKILLFIIFMLLYSYFFARRFNRRIYKFSVQKTLKGGVIGK